MTPSVGFFLIQAAGEAAGSHGGGFEPFLPGLIILLPFLGFVINGALALQGDSAPLLELQHIIASLDMDWEAPLVDTLGDVAGHQLAQTLRSLAGWGNQASRSLARQLEEFIHEEARLTPPRLELEDFYRDVQDLGMRVERLQSLVARFRRRLQKFQA